MEQGLHRVFGGRLAGTHHTVDGHAGSKLVNGFVDTQGLGNVRALIQFVGVQALHILNTGRAEFFQQCFGQLFVGLCNDLAGIGIDDVASQHAADQEVLGHADVCRAGLLQFAGMTGSDALVFRDHHLAGFVRDVVASNFTAQALGNVFHLCTAVHQAEVVVDEEVGKDGFRRQANRLQQDGDRHLAATVHTEEQDVFGVELEVQPRTTVRNDPCREQQLA